MTQSWRNVKKIRIEQVVKTDMHTHTHARIHTHTRAELVFGGNSLTHPRRHGGAEPRGSTGSRHGGTRRRGREPAAMWKCRTEEGVHARAGGVPH